MTTGIVGSDALEKGVARPLLLSSDEEHQDEDLDQECEASEEAPKESRQAANSFGSAYRLLTPSVKVCLWFTLSLGFFMSPKCTIELTDFLYLHLESVY